jgi:hypothetical protein
MKKDVLVLTIPMTLQRGVWKLFVLHVQSMSITWAYD